MAFGQKKKSLFTKLEPAHLPHRGIVLDISELYINDFLESRGCLPVVLSWNSIAILIPSSCIIIAES